MGSQESGNGSQLTRGHSGSAPPIPTFSSHNSLSIGSPACDASGCPESRLLTTDSWFRFTLCFCVSAVILLFVVPVKAQKKTPPVRVNVLNVCTPGAAEQKEIAAALARIPLQPRWGSDFEVARGRTTLSEDAAAALTGKRSSAAAGPISDWVRIRREFHGPSPFANALYSFSVDKKEMVETLVFPVRDPKDLLQVSLSETVSTVTTPAAALAAGTPPDHVRLERFGQASVVLARCVGSPDGPRVDQSAYEPLFRKAATILAAYRSALAVRRTVPEELARVGQGTPSAARRPAKK